MIWSKLTLVYACGCKDTQLDGKLWDEYDPGDEITCSEHGKTTIARKSRVSESKGGKR